MENPFKIKQNCDIDLSCLGILVLDVFGSSIDSFPDKGTSEYFQKLEIYPGGCAFNTGVDAARLGLKVSVFGKVGSDYLGDIIIENLAKERISTDSICRSGDINTAFSFVMVPSDGQRRIYHSPGINDTYCIQDISIEAIEKTAILHIAGAGLMKELDGKPAAKILKSAREKGALTSMDPVVMKGISSMILPCLPYLDIFLPNKEESVYITGYEDEKDQLKFYLDSGVRLAGIKTGSKGCIIGDGKDILHMGAYSVQVADTCGAGDAFIAGFLYGILQEWDIEKTARFATAAASFCVRTIGAAAAMPGAKEVLDFMNETVLKEYTDATHQ